MKPLRNIAIIAHVDHGKTTLVDHLLRQCGAFSDRAPTQDCVMDSNPLERERGITILAKNTSLDWKGVKINVIDTPGHHDFSGEVERVLRMADGALLLVDAADGPMPQTRFVLKRALEAGVRPIVVINKLDRPEARPEWALEEVFYLFMELNATDEQIDFPVVYAIGREGKSKKRLNDPWSTLEPLFATILLSVPPPADPVDGPLQIGVCAIDYNDYVGRMAIGRIFRGVAEVGKPVVRIGRGGVSAPGKIVDLRTFRHLERIPATRVEAGDIVCIAGMPEVNVGDTLTDPEHPDPLDIVHVDEPTVALHFMVNDSPLSGREGSVLTARQLGNRLEREANSDPALRVQKTDAPGTFRVCGRGLLHLSILVERMRREGSEVQVSRPEILTREVDGVKCEPMERATIDVPTEFVSRVLELAGKRRGLVDKVDPLRERTLLAVRIPARGLIGLHGLLLSATRGQAVMHTAFEGWEPDQGEAAGRAAGVMIASEPGEATTYALDQLRARGVFFVTPGQPVYEGMVVGEHCHENDLVVHIARKRKLDNMRVSQSEAKEALPEPHIPTLEDGIEYVNDDEIVEVTPKTVRLRKRVLSKSNRRRLDRASSA